MFMYKVILVTKVRKKIVLEEACTSYPISCDYQFGNSNLSVIEILAKSHVGASNPNTTQ